MINFRIVKMKYIFVLVIFLFVPFIVFAKHEINKYFSDQEYLYKVNFSQYISWQLTEGEGVVVAIIDDGVWLQHPDLIGSNWSNINEIPNNSIDDDNNGYIDDYYGWNFIDNKGHTQKYQISNYKYCDIMKNIK